MYSRVNDFMDLIYWNINGTNICQHFKDSSSNLMFPSKSEYYNMIENQIIFTPEPYPGILSDHMGDSVRNGLRQELTLKIVEIHVFRRHS